MSQIRGIFLDAFGTILQLESPVPGLVRELGAGWGIDLTEEEARRAFSAEVTYYKAHHLEGCDPDSLVDLRLRSAAALRDGLPARVREHLSAAELLPVLMRAIRFHPFPDVIAALGRFRAAGLGIVVVSNWDISLGGVIDGCGLGGLVDHVVSSAGVGAAKPSPLPFERALDLLGLDPDSVVHVGDSPEHDVAGAVAAGIAPVLIRRGSDRGVRSDPEVSEIETLAGFSPALP